MVLQCDTPVPVWGRAKAGAAVAVSFAGQTKTTRADDRGNWTLHLDPLPASGEPREMRVGDFVIRDVLVGEVWLCSGQSNMRWIVGPVGKFPGVEGADEEIARPESPGLRLFSDDGEEMWQQRGWQRAGGEQVARFSATAYFFGQMLHDELGVPIGVINVSRGGTSVQAWTRREFALRNPFTRHYVELEARSRDIIRDYNAAQREARLARQTGRKDSAQPTALDPEIEIARVFQVAHLYDAHIEPLAPFAIRGVVWYQGESNASRLKTSQADGSTPQDLIEGWRDRWAQPRCPGSSCSFPAGAAPLPFPGRGCDKASGRLPVRCRTSASPPPAMCPTSATSIPPRNAKQAGGSPSSRWRERTASPSSPTGHPREGSVATERVCGSTSTTGCRDRTQRRPLDTCRTRRP